MTATKFQLATFYDINNYVASDSRRTYGSKRYLVANEETPFGDKNIGDLAKSLGSTDSLRLRGLHIADHSSSHYYDHPWRNGVADFVITPKKTHSSLASYPYFLWATAAPNQDIDDEEIDEEDVVDTKVKGSKKLAEVAATARNLRLINLPYEGYYYSNNLNDISGYYYDFSLGNARLCVEVTIDGQDVLMVMTPSFAEQVFGLEVTTDMKLRLSNGTESDFTGYKDALTNIRAYRNGSYRANNLVSEFDFTFDTLSVVVNRIGMNSRNTEMFLKALDLGNYKISPLPASGVKKVLQTVEPLAEELRKENPLAYCAFRSLVFACSRAIDGVKISSIFNELMEGVKSKQDLLKVIKPFYKWSSGSLNLSIDNKIKSHSSFKVKRKAVIKSQAGRALTKIMDDAESLTIDRKKHKLTWAKIESGELPLGAFFRKSEQYFILNDNWDLWEEMFKRGYGEQAIELANEVKGRSTYEKDLMSYFYFVLYSLPKYLKKHTGEKWTCIPKLVNSSDELEPPKEEGGVARKRSALTPVADNETKTVLVPYASLAIYGGRGTTYCYSHDYHVLHEGMSFNGYAVSEEIETKLNGRDDYGLMFYTLTGSAQGRGYPTFLIIFERRESHKDTRVHFHRTHPSRSKEGDYNPIHNWIRVCYNWMAGNVHKDRIKAQQGDLAFVSIKTEDSPDEMEGNVVKGLTFEHKVNKYDNHCFAEPVAFCEYTKAAKSNILGYVRLPQDTWLNHNEHDNVLIPKGDYAIHQCRSWEANPKGVWSLRID